MAQYSKLETAHIAEAGDKGAEFYNLGWFSSRNRIESKTDKGILVSIRNADGSFRHDWRDVMTYGEKSDAVSSLVLRKITGLTFDKDGQVGLKLDDGSILYVPTSLVKERLLTEQERWQHDRTC